MKRRRSERGVQTLLFDRMSPIRLRVRELRNKRGWTQQQLAERAGVRRATISELESGRVPERVKLATLEKIARALGVPTLKLLRES